MQTDTPRGASPRAVGPQPDGVVVTDEHLQILAFAGGAEQLFGWSGADVIGTHWFTRIPTEITGPNASEIWQDLRDGREIRTGAHCQRQDGVWVDVDVSAIPLRGGDGRLTGWLGLGFARRAPASPEPLPEAADAGRSESWAHPEFLRMCMYCRKVRDDEGRWQSLERYIEQRRMALFSHGVCPECEQAVVDAFDRTR